jgi:hypothetical protein
VLKSVKAVTRLPEAEALAMLQSSKPAAHFREVSAHGFKKVLICAQGALRVVSTLKNNGALLNK